MMVMVVMMMLAMIKLNEQTNSNFKQDRFYRK